YHTARARAVMDNLAVALPHSQGGRYIKKGHTDATGTEDYNEWLSERRAVSVNNYLVSKGFRKSGITTEDNAQSKPVSSNNTPEGRQKNRRVGIVVVDGN